MDDLRQSVQGAVYEQKDPLLIYKFESFELFKGLISRVNQEIVSFLFRGNLPENNPRKFAELQPMDLSSLNFKKDAQEMLRSSPTGTRLSLHQDVRHR